MSATAERLRLFATEVLTRAGAVVEWPETALSGEALLTPELATRFAVPEAVSIATAGGEGELRLDLAGDTLERLQGLLDSSPWTAGARLSERPAKNLDAHALVSQSVDIANARVRLGNAASALSEYQRWHVAVQIDGEESWEELITLTMHAASCQPVQLELPDREELLPWRAGELAPGTLPEAIRLAGHLAEVRAAGFVARMALRRERDRKRLRDYYIALMKPARRSGRPSSKTPEQEQAQRTAVDLELSRKLEEIDERSRLRCRIQPIALVRIQLPVWALDVTVQRREAVRTVRMYWNHRTGGLEPLACAVCGQSGRTFLARDRDVALLCAGCSLRGSAG